MQQLRHLFDNAITALDLAEGTFIIISLVLHFDFTFSLMLFLVLLQVTGKLLFVKFMHTEMTWLNVNRIFTNIRPTAES